METFAEMRGVRTSAMAMAQNLVVKYMVAAENWWVVLKRY